MTPLTTTPSHLESNLALYKKKAQEVVSHSYTQMIKAMMESVPQYNFQMEMLSSFLPQVLGERLAKTHIAEKIVNQIVNNMAKHAPVAPQAATQAYEKTQALQEKTSSEVNHD